MTTSNDLFRIIRANYLASAVEKAQYPELSLPEFSFVGRSNVGKSSLINSLCNRRQLARVSQTPGKTQTLNFYQIDCRQGDEDYQIHFVDLPGYGYAKHSRRKQTFWGQFIEDYLVESPHLRCVFQLIDLRLPPQDSDLAVYEWLTEQNIPVQLIATKSDKLGTNALNKQVQLLQKAFLPQGGLILPYSSANQRGRQELLDRIQHYLLN